MTSPQFASDIETGPQTEEELLLITYPYNSKLWPHKWKKGNIKDPKKIEAKNKEREGAYNQAAADGLLWKHLKAALDPALGRVLYIGFTGSSSEPVLGFSSKDEAVNLELNWELYESTKREGGRVVGHNWLGFDLPYLIRRSWLCDVTVPDWIYQIRGDRIYFDEMFIDTMKIWPMGRRGADEPSLNDLAAMFGVGGKADEEVTGETFHLYWNGSPEEHAKALKYAQQDVRLTAKIVELMGLV